MSRGHGRQRSSQAALLLFALATVATGCVPQPPALPGRCLPIGGLLEGSYNLNAGATVTGLFDFHFIRSEERGSFLPGQAADLAVLTDACLAWDAGKMPDAQYFRLFAAYNGAAMAETGGSEADARINKILAYIDKQANANNADAVRAAEQTLRTDASSTPGKARQDALAAQQDAAPYIMVWRSTADTNQLLLSEVRALKAMLAGPPEAAWPARVRVHFATSDVSLDTLNELDAAAKAWRRENVPVDVEGFADPRGNRGINDKLSLDRAKRVAQYLRDNGVDVRKVSSGGIASDLASVYGRERYVDVTATR